MAYRLSNGVPASQVSVDGLVAYTTAVAGAIGTLGGSTWQEAYGNSNAVATAIGADIGDSASSTKLLTDTLSLYNTIVAGAVGSIAVDASQATYNSIFL